jgi:pantetheine-phosphate adenylyltransferase
MRTVLYTGSFDPPTLGHIDIVRRAAGLFDRLVIGVGANAAKRPLFDRDERIALLRGEIASFVRLADIEVLPFDGLAVDFAAAVGATAIVRGLRGPADLGFEAPMAGMNGAMAPGVDTVFLVARPALSAIASSLVKDVAWGQGDVAKFVSPAVAAAIAARIAGSSAGR